MKTLNDFFEEYYTWVQSGAPRFRFFKPRFTRSRGLCYNFLVFLDHHFDEIEFDCPPFIQHLFESPFPFNEEAKDYYDESNKKQCHLNKKRIDFVKKQLGIE